MPTIFSKIINGEIPCHKVAENDDFLAFLDISPNSIGHTLCIPKLEIDDILDLDEETYKNLMLFSLKVAKSIKKVIKCKKVAMSVIGLEVPHVHVHLIPREPDDQAGPVHSMFKDRPKLSDEELEQLYAKIKNS